MRQSLGAHDSISVGLPSMIISSLSFYENNLKNIINNIIDIPKETQNRFLTLIRSGIAAIICSANVYTRTSCSPENITLLVTQK